MSRLFTVTDVMVDQAGQALRERMQAGKGNLVEWSKLPRSSKRKWVEHARHALEAASVLKTNAEAT